MNAEADSRFMRLALALGRRGQGRCWPNPAVGCVIVAAGRIIGRGWTQPGGRPHAEVRALEQAGAQARGGCAYVTLEPCAHHGQTPPCTDALIAAGIARVVTALTDPDPRVAGRGHARLRAAGVAVVEGVESERAARDHAGFLNRVTHGRPMLSLKLASSFDGRIATAAGESRWITGHEARRRVHGLRLSHDAVLIGAGTARADDPMLDIRGFGVVSQPVRVVATRDLNLPLDGRLGESAGRQPLWLLFDPKQTPLPRQEAWKSRGAQLMAAAAGTDGGLDPASILAALGAAGLTRVLCEGGGLLAAALLRADLVDELIGFTAGLVLGAEGRSGIGALEVTDLAAAPRFELIESRALGGDVLHHWRRRAA